MDPTGSRPVEDEEFERARERRLLAQAQAGDQEAFAELVRPHLRTLHKVANLIVGDERLAEDVVTTTLLNAWRFIGTFKARSQDNRPVRFSTWMYKIAHRSALRELRRNVPEPVGDASELPTPSTPGADIEVIERLTIREALQQLPDLQRTALVMREIVGMTYLDIADAQDSVANVKTRLYRAREKMQRLLGEE
jgi:RNA polymerase sigma-70 factor (ECF subfamily)